ncbi:MAG: type I-D CRISPR-associated protein Cas5/Csc1 [Blastocatellia bacterium]
MTTILCCDLELHDSLYFATREIGRLYETERILHNYALCYALGLATSEYFARVQTPNYRRDLTLLNERGIYVTPARDVSVDFSLNTWKYASNHYHVLMEKAQTNTPTFGRVKEISAESRFRFFIISQDGEYHPPQWIRLGKWMSKARLSVSQRADNPKRATGDFEVKHPLNPLDVLPNCQIMLCDLINMPPVSLVNNARVNGEHFVIEATGHEKMHLPAKMSFNFDGVNKRNL